jgi:hypothetical protein
MSTKQRNAAWAQFYTLCGVANADEATKLALRCAVYVYAAKNGTSPQGPYRYGGVSAKGTNFLGVYITTAVGRTEVRRFFRSNADESVDFFLETEALTKDPDIRKECEREGIALSDAICLCDWLDGHPKFTPEQQRQHSRLKNRDVSRARAGRGNRDLDDVRADEDSAIVASQGHVEVPATQRGGW